MKKKNSKIVTGHNASDVIRASSTQESIWVAINYAQTASGEIPWPLFWLWSGHDACFVALPRCSHASSFFFFAIVSQPACFNSVTFVIPPTRLHAVIYRV
jgi:hypothetical protein